MLLLGTFNSSAAYGHPHFHQVPSRGIYISCPSASMQSMFDSAAYGHAHFDPIPSRGIYVCCLSVTIQSIQSVLLFYPRLSSPLPVACIQIDSGWVLNPLPKDQWLVDAQDQLLDVNGCPWSIPLFGCSPYLTFNTFLLDTHLWCRCPGPPHLLFLPSVARHCSILGRGGRRKYHTFS